MDYEPVQLNMLGGVNASQCGLAATSRHPTRLATAAPGDRAPPLPWSREFLNRQGHGPLLMQGRYLLHTRQSKIIQ